MKTIEELEAQLETVTRERDEARAEVERLREEFATQADISSSTIARMKQQQREARAEVERLRVKAEAYGGMVDGCGPALEAAGHPIDPFQPDGRVGGIARSVAALIKERDEARAELAALRKRVVEALPYPTDDDSDESHTAEEAIEMAVAERDAAYRSRDLAIKMWDEARAEADRWKRSCNMFRERDWPKAFQATVTSLEREVSDAHDELAKLRRLSKPWEGDAYRRGAEAMRLACLGVVERFMDFGSPHPGMIAHKMSALPIPEET